MYIVYVNGKIYHELTHINYCTLKLMVVMTHRIYVLKVALGHVRTEDHIIVDCALPRAIRDRNPHMVFTLPEFWGDNLSHDVCKVVYDLLNLYE